MTEYVHVGRHADILDSGRHVGPGDRVTDEHLTAEDEHLIEEGRLIDVTSFDGAHSNAEQIVRDEPQASSAKRVTTTAPAGAKSDEEGSHGDS